MENLQKQDLRKISSKIGGFFLLIVFFQLNLTFLVSFVKYFLPINSTILNIFISFFSYIVPLLIMLKTMSKKPSDLMSIKKPKKQLFSYVTIGIILAVMANFVTIFVIKFLKNYNINSVTPKIAFEYENTPLGIVLFLISLSIVPAITEEFLCRGVILGSLRKFGDNFAVFASALFFGLMHGNIEQFMFAFLLGLYLGFSVVKTNSILPAVLIHFFNNLITGLIVVFKVEEFSMLMIIYYVVVFVISSACFIKLYKENKSNITIRKDKTDLSFGKRMSAFIFNPGMILFLVYVGVFSFLLLNFQG